MVGEKVLSGEIYLENERCRVIWSQFDLGSKGRIQCLVTENDGFQHWKTIAYFPDLVQAVMEYYKHYNGEEGNL